jgi:hypothetical protein
MDKNNTETNVDRVYANMASIPKRMKYLEIVVAHILPQVDILNIYLNNFEEIPWFLKDNKKINIIRSQDEGDRGDAGKFFWSDKVNGYYFTIDDDIIYPPNYIAKLKEGLDRRGKRCAVGFHGEMYGNEIKHWTKDRLGTFHFYYELEKDTPTCILGTGCMGYHTDFIKVTPEDFEIPNMADVWFTKLCHRQGKFRVVLSHQRGWLQILPIPEEDTIWGKTLKEENENPDKTSKEVELIQECLPWKYIQDVNI